MENSGPLLVEWRSPSDLTLNPRNPRRHSPRQIKQIARSVASFGFNVPVLVDDNDTVIVGNGRVLAARTLGLATVPVIRLGHLTAAQAQAFAIADNRLTENSTWDDRLLGEIFLELASLELSFSLEATGFSMGEIDMRIEGLTEGAPADGADALPAVSDLPPVSRPGDLWLLDEHRLLCANALDSAAYELLMRGRRAQIVFADPPYNVRIHGHASGNGGVRHREFAMASGEMTPDQFISFLAAVMHQLAQHSDDGSIHFVCIDWRHLLELLSAGKQVYTELKNLCVWVKSNPGMGSFYRSQHELVAVFKNGTSPHRNNIELGRHGRNRSNVWTHPGANAFGRQGEEGKLLAIHPTVKPVSLIADALMDASARRDVVLDAFLGSGSTLVAAEHTGRVCYGIELDPLYVDAAIRRWQRYSGRDAVHAETSRRFDEIAAGPRDE